GPVLEDRLRIGLFSWRHIPHNVARGVLGLPILHDRFPFVRFDPTGQSLFLISPFLLAIFWAGFKGPWRLAAWAAAFGVLGTFLCYFSTGYVQFGYRYAVEAMPFLLLLVASAFDGRVTPLFTWSIRLAVVVNLFGTLWILNWGRMAHQLLRAAGLD
ncbi:MAG TPA: hypothetical protein VMG58_13200, partial [Candidatus Sulfotelmatobacter sp.]|nr:hypothetical protein [Candidatus Sulfotelmatobacter sp.]